MVVQDEKKLDFAWGLLTLAALKTSGMMWRAMVGTCGAIATWTALECAGRGYFSGIGTAFQSGRARGEVRFDESTAMAQVGLVCAAAGTGAVGQPGVALAA
jgi:hypothetical protein